MLYIVDPVLELVAQLFGLVLDTRLYPSSDNLRTHLIETVLDADKISSQLTQARFEAPKNCVTYSLGAFLVMAIFVKLESIIRIRARI